MWAVLFMSKYWPRRHAPLPPKCKHCCNPYQYCGGTIKLAFAAKKPELAVDLAVKYLKKAAVKDILIIRRARQTRKQAKPTCVIRYTSFRSCRAFALCLKTKMTLFVSKTPNSALFIFIRTSLSNRKKRTNPKAPTSSKSVLRKWTAFFSGVSP